MKEILFGVIMLVVSSAVSTVVLAAQAAPGDPTNLKDLIAKAKASSRTVTPAAAASGAIRIAAG